MRIALTSLFVAAAVVSIALPAAADEPESPAAPSAAGATLAPSTSHTLAQVHGGLTADSARVAGRSRDIEMSVAKGAAAKVVRPAPTPRVLRRMGPERVISAIDPAVRACVSESTTTSPTTFALRISVAPGGEVEGSELASTTRATPALIACVVRAAAAAHFGAPGAAGASIVLPITVPGRAATAVTPDTTTVTISSPPASAPVAAESPPAEPVATRP
jgi:hypothetical protein